VPEGYFGGPEEERQKRGDSIVEFVSSWMLVAGENSPELVELLTRRWQSGMGRDELLAATLDEIDIPNPGSGHVELGARADEMVKRHGAGRPKLLFRMHPENFNFYANNLLPPRTLGGPGREIRCNWKQPRGKLAISTAEVESDVPCKTSYP
jgi:hypothetical protein